MPCFLGWEGELWLPISGGAARRLPSRPQLACLTLSPLTHSPRRC